MSEKSINKFSDFLSIEMGQSPSSDNVNFEKKGLPLLNGPAEFTDRYPIPVQYSTFGNRFANKNDILFCVRGSTTGRMNIADRSQQHRSELLSASLRRRCIDGSRSL